MTLTGRGNGPKKPSGSNGELTVERMPRLVCDLLVGTTLNCKVFEVASQCNPSARLIGSWLRSVDIDRRICSLLL